MNTEKEETYEAENIKKASGGNVKEQEFCGRCRRNLNTGEGR